MRTVFWLHYVLYSNIHSNWTKLHTFLWLFILKYLCQYRKEISWEIQRYFFLVKKWFMLLLFWKCNFESICQRIFNLLFTIEWNVPMQLHLKYVIWAIILCCREATLYCFVITPFITHIDIFLCTVLTLLTHKNNCPQLQCNFDLAFARTIYTGILYIFWIFSIFWWKCEFLLSFFKKKHILLFWVNFSNRDVWFASKHVSFGIIVLLCPEVQCVC